MKHTYIYLLSAVALLATACEQSHSDAPAPKQLELIGTWRAEKSNGERISTNDRTILTYISSTKFTMSLSRYIPEFQEFTWRNKAMGDYAFDGMNLVQSAADPGTKYINRAYAIDDRTMVMYYDTFVNKKGLSTPMADTLIYSRVGENLGYEELILGTWEGVSHTGLETYGDHNHRWIYKDKDRSDRYEFVYLNYDTLNQQWVPNAQSSSEYNIHGSWLATRWLPQDSQQLNYEWWDIDDITDSTMTWSAWRITTDTSYLATFSFRKVVE